MQSVPRGTLCGLPPAIKIAFRSNSHWDKCFKQRGLAIPPERQGVMVFLICSVWNHFDEGPICGRIADKSFLVFPNLQKEIEKIDLMGR